MDRRYYIDQIAEEATVSVSVPHQVKSLNLSRTSDSVANSRQGKAPWCSGSWGKGGGILPSTSVSDLSFLPRKELFSENLALILG